MRQAMLIFILTGLVMGFHSPLYADEAGIGWGDDGNGLTSEEPAGEASAADADSWFDQLVELLVTEEPE